MDGTLTEKLIQAVRQRPVLYLCSHRDFKKNAGTTQAWKEIQEELNEDVEALKNRWKNLRDTYKKCKNARRGKGMSNLACWVWAGQMSFLDIGNPTPKSPTPDETPANSSFPTIKQEKTSDQEESDSEIASRDTEKKQTEDILKKFEVAVFQDSTDKYLSLKRKKTGQADKINTDYKYYKRHRSGNDGGGIEVSCDRVDLFFLGLAHSFKELSRRTQIKTKFDLAKVLKVAELNDLQDNKE